MSIDPYAQDRENFRSLGLGWGEYRTCALPQRAPEYILLRYITNDGIEINREYSHAGESESFLKQRTELKKDGFKNRDKIEAVANKVLDSRFDFLMTALPRQYLLFQGESTARNYWGIVYKTDEKEIHLQYWSTAAERSQELSSGRFRDFSLFAG